MSTAAPGAGRFAPSPSGDLHLGNLRTALLAWLFARSTGRSFRIRMEDLDRVAPGTAERQLADLAALGLDHDGEVVRQSGRTAVYDAAIDDLARRGLTFECFCTRREITQAATAPHGDPVPEGAYPGTCRDLTAGQRDHRRAQRPPAIRLRAGVSRFTVHDQLHGEFTGVVDDLVLRRSDGVAAYNLAVVVDDAAHGVDQVVRGEDLLPSSPRQAYLAGLLGLPVPDYLHVPLAVSADGRRLAKRDGPVTMTALAERGVDADGVRRLLTDSLGLPAVTDPRRLIDRFDPAALPRSAWIVHPAGDWLDVRRDRPR